MARVMIVDDSFVARRAQAKILTELGHTVVGTAADGTQAFAEYSRLQPDVVTMDLTMPGMSGGDAMTKILASFPEARIIVISASEERDVVFDALERGARHYIIKPVTAEKVAATVASVLKQNFDQEKYRDIVRMMRESDQAPCELARCLATADTRSPHILIVDDSAVARQCLREIVTELGYTVAGEAENGSQAFVEYARLRPDIVTMDLTMQGMDGADATSKIIATFPEARIVVISAMEERQVVVDSLERGARHFIIKPITREKVCSVLTNVLRQKFDLDKHLELVRKLKDSADPLSPLKAPTYSPPYRIAADDKLIMITINPTLTATSCRTLAIELQEYLTGSPRVLLDFGTAPKMQDATLAEIDTLIREMEKKSATVKALSRSRDFVDSVAKDGKTPSLNAILQHFTA